MASRRRIERARPHARNARTPFILIRKPKKACAKTKRVHAMTAAGWSTVLIAAAALQFAVLPDTDARTNLAEIATLEFTPPPALEPLPAPDPADVRLLAATMWAEARSEGEDGMRAVGHVMVNRVGERFGEDLRTVILAPKQFSAWNRGDPNRPLAMNPDRYATGGEARTTWIAAQRIAEEVLTQTSVDPTEGALFYHTRAIRPTWSRHGVGRHVIGAHVFYRDVPDQRRRGTVRRITDIPQGGEATFTQVSSQRRGPRAGRVNGVIQYAPADYNERGAASDATPAPTLTVGGQAVDVSTPSAPAATPTAPLAAPIATTAF